MSSAKSASTPSGQGWRLKEVRYSLKELIEETAMERNTGAFGLQKLHQSEITKLFPAKKTTRKRHGSGS